MQDDTPTHQIDLFSEAPPAELPGAMLAEAIRLVEQNDLDGCLRLAAWAYVQPNASAIPALCTLLQRPQPWNWRQLYGTLHRRRLWRREGWIRMRIQAIHALERIGSPEAAISVTNALVYDCPEVRPHAAAALQTLKSHSLRPLVSLIRSKTPTDWPLEGMVAAIDALGGLQNKKAGPTLAHILFGDHPLPASRYTLSPIGQAFLLTLCELAILIPILLSNSKDIIDGSGILVAMLFGCCAMLGPLTMLNFMLCFPVSVFRQFRQRIALYKAASRALTAIQDKMSIPSLVEIALGTQTPAAQTYARTTLLALLPLVDAGDAGLLTGLGKTERLLTSAFSRHDADPPLILAILRALEFIGTGQSAPPVERLVNRRPTSHDALTFSEIRTEAERILPILKERQRQEEASSVLLRASNMPPVAPAQLLRPARYLDAEPEEQLLRPTE